MPGPTDSKKPTLGGLLREAAAEFSGFDRGVPYTVKCLLSAPGAIVRRYLDERDTRITRPLRLFAVALALYFVSASLAGVDELNAQFSQQILGSEGPGASAFLEFATRYQTALFALALPLMMLATRVAWPRSGRTLAEHLSRLGAAADHRPVRAGRIGPEFGRFRPVLHGAPCHRGPDPVVRLSGLDDGDVLFRIAYVVGDPGHRDPIGHAIAVLAHRACSFSAVDQAHRSRGCLMVAIASGLEKPS